MAYLTAGATATWWATAGAAWAKTVAGAGAAWATAWTVGADLCTTALKPLWSSAVYSTVRTEPSGSTRE